MLSIRLITSGGEDYYINLAAEDYYLAGGEPPGVWLGAGAPLLMLTGKVDPQAFRRVFRGYHPGTGAGLVQNAGYSDRQCAWDLTFSAPKSLSIVWSTAPLAVRVLIQKLQQLAVEAALCYAEEKLVFSRAGKGGVNSVSVRLVAAAFEHGTSRSLQCQLHTHLILMNLGIANDSKVRAIYSKLLFKFKKVLGAYYRAYFAHLLESELGFSLVRKGDSFEIDGVPEDLIKLHSQRRAEILAYLKQKGQHGAIAAAEAALKTRRTKKDIPPRSELFQRWQDFNRAHGFTEASVASLPRPKPRDLAEDIPRALAAAQKSIARRHSHFSYRDFLFEVLLEAPKWGISPEALLEPVQDHLANGNGIIRLRQVDGEVRYTTQGILKQEARLLTLLKRLRHARGLSISDRKLNKVLAKYPSLRPDQVAGLRHLTQSSGSVRIVCGKAGSGKTTLLRAAREAWRSQGYRVLGATFQGKAARVLQDTTGIETETIHRRLVDYKTSPKRAVKRHLKNLVHAAQGKRAVPLKKPRPMKIDSKTILVVDEAGRVDSRHMRMLMKKVYRGGGTLVLVGDPGQLPAIKGTSPFQSICRRAPHAELTQISRQDELWARQAVELFANGKPGDALRLYADHGSITVREDREEALRALVLDWTAVGLTTPEQAAVLVSTNLESEAANAMCQEKRLQAGCLNPSHFVDIRDEDLAKGITYRNRAHIGDRILFTRNDRRYGVENGAVGTVIGLIRLPFRKAIAVRLDDGRRVIVPVNKFPHVRLGYAMTTHKAQGVTVPEVFVLAGGSMQDLPISYVQASRSIRTTRFYTEKTLLNECLENIDDSPLARQMAHAPDLTLATDLLPDGPLSAPDKALSSGHSSGPTTSAQKESARLKRKLPPPPLRRRYPAKANPDLTYGMAQVEALKRLRRQRLREAAVANGLDLLSLPKVPKQELTATEEVLAAHYLHRNAAALTIDPDTSTNLPTEVILDAHFHEFALQADHHERCEELQRQQEELEELRRQQQAAAACRAPTDSYQEPSWQLSPSSVSVLASSSSTPWPFALSPVSSAEATPPAWPIYDAQQYFATGSAQTQWTQHNNETTTTFLVRY